MPIITMQKAKSPSYVTISITPFQKGSDKPPAECDSAKNILTERVEKSKVDKSVKIVYTKSIKRRCQQTVCPSGVNRNNR